MTGAQSSEELPDRLRRWGRRALIAAVVVIAVVVLCYMGAAFLPRWWSHRIGAQAGGSFGAGIALGLFYGFVFTALPLLLLVWAFARRHSWKVRGWTVVVAALLATPNLLTLGVVLGSGGAAHAGERTLDVDAPGFRASSLIGAIAVLVAFFLVGYLVASRRRSRWRVEGLREELRRREDPQAEPEPPGAPET
jgi:MFS family permease